MSSENHHFENDVKIVNEIPLKFLKSNAFKYGLTDVQHYTEKTKIDLVRKILMSKYMKNNL